MIEALDRAAETHFFKRAGGVIGHGHVPELFREALARHPTAARTCDKFGYTLLMSAASLGCESSVDILLPLSDAKHACPFGETALMCAAANGRARIVEKLLPHSDIHAKTKKSYTAFGWACDGCHLDVAQILIERHGASLAQLPCAPGSATGLMRVLRRVRLRHDRPGSLALAHFLLPLSNLLAVDDAGFNAIAHAAESGDSLAMEFAARAIHDLQPDKAHHICCEAVRKVEAGLLPGYNSQIFELTRASERLVERADISESSPQALAPPMPAKRI